MDPYISSEVALDVEKTLFPVKPSLLTPDARLSIGMKITIPVAVAAAKGQPAPA